jgi:hypothetical protein
MARFSPMFVFVAMARSVEMVVSSALAARSDAGVSFHEAHLFLLGALVALVRCVDMVVFADVAHFWDMAVPGSLYWFGCVLGARLASCFRLSQVYWLASRNWVSRSIWLALLWWLSLSRWLALQWWISPI